jgi:hypothetical protein
MSSATDMMVEEEGLEDREDDEEAKYERRR